MRNILLNDKTLHNKTEDTKTGAPESYKPINILSHLIISQLLLYLNKYPYQGVNERMTIYRERKDFFHWISYKTKIQLVNNNNKTRK